MIPLKPFCSLLMTVFLSFTLSCQLTESNCNSALVKQAYVDCESATLLLKNIEEVLDSENQIDEEARQEQTACMQDKFGVAAYGLSSHSEPTDRKGENGLTEMWLFFGIDTRLIITFDPNDRTVPLTLEGLPGCEFDPNDDESIVCDDGCEFSINGHLNTDPCGLDNSFNSCSY